MKQSRVAISTAFALSALSLICVGAFGAPLDEARSLLASGKPAEVDAKLGSLLDKRPYNIDALKLSVDANIKAGRPYTAERRVSALLESGKLDDKSYIFKGALVSKMLGKSTTARDRLRFYLREEKGWNENVEQALMLICEDTAEADYFTRYMERTTPTPAVFNFGLHIFDRQKSERRADDIAKHLPIMFLRFPAKTQQERLMRVLFGVDQEITTRALFDALPRAVKWEVFDKKFPEVLSQKIRNTPADKCGAKQVAAMTLAAGVLPPVDVFARVADYGTNISDPNDRQKFASEYLKLERLIFPAPPAEGQPAPQVAAEYQIYFLMGIARTPDAFMVKGVELVNSQKLAQLTAKAVVSAQRDGKMALARSLMTDIVNRRELADAHLATMKKSYPDAFDARSLVWPTVVEEARKTKNLAPMREIFAKTGNRLDIRWLCLGAICDVGDANLIKEIAREHIMTFPHAFDVGAIGSYVINCEALGAGDRVNFLRDLYGKTGFTQSWADLARWGASSRLKDDVAWKAFAENIKQGAQGSDGLVGSWSAMIPLKGEQSQEATALMLKAIAAYGNNPYPNPRNPQASKILENILGRYRDFTGTPELAQKWFDAFVARAADSSILAQLYDLASRTKNPTNTLNAAAALLKCADANYSSPSFCSIAIPRGYDKPSPLAPYYAKMVPELAARHVKDNYAEYYNGQRVLRWTPAARMNEIKTLINSIDLGGVSGDTLVALIAGMSELVGNDPALAAEIPFAKLSAEIFGKNGVSAWARSELMMLYYKVGKADEGMKAFISSIANLDEVSKAYELLYMAEHCREISPERETPAKDGQPAVAPVITQTKFVGYTKQHMLPAIKKVPLKSAKLMPRVDNRLLHDNAGWTLSTREISDDDKGVIREFNEVFGKLLAYNMPQADVINSQVQLRNAWEKFVATKDYELLARIARAYGIAETRYGSWEAHTNIKKAMDIEAWEAAHLASSAEAGGNQDYKNTITRYRTECGQHMTGIYPVGENDPAYPLYVAADEMEHNNSEHAWELLSKNIQVFEREAGKLPPTFVAWGVEQLRMARGNNDTLIYKARSIIDALLAKESTLSPELAASLVLSRAEIFRDLQNYEAARLEYDTLRNSNNYKGTAAARKGMFRAVDLMIHMGNPGGAENTIELWLSQPDIEIQAQARYFMAAIAFARQDYEETRKQLNEVFNLNFTHTEARLLHGKWKLATNNEVDDTAVWVGELSDRKVIRPGQQLTITVQDRNLGVAGAGTAIPIVIEAGPADAPKDVEVITLYPTTRDPYLFRGVIETALAIATPSNRVLEVLGGDSVRYYIQGTFLKSRGLTAPPPKELSIVDDARLAIGAGAPDAEDGAAESELEQAIMSHNTEQRRETSLSGSLRPGNPIYVVVRDRDRSRSSEPDTISVTAETSSGDRIEGVELTETEATSGIFRGVIESRLPPPRASASDSAAGFNVGDTINSKRDGMWKSLPDAQLGKWIEVDTMGSHSVSNVAIMMPNSENVSNIRLTGRLADETLRLGSLPQENIAKRYGILYQVREGRKMNSEQEIRRAFSSANAPAVNSTTNFAYRPWATNRDVQCNALLSAAIMVPTNVPELNFRLQASQLKSGRILSGLWMAFALDGVTVFTGQGNSLQGQLVTFTVAPGEPHLLEVFFSGNYPEDALDIVYEPMPGVQSALPTEWIDPKQSPELEDFLKDRAIIKRTKGGFQATFEKPVRLRSLRWEFLGYKGNELNVQKIYVQDDSGKLVIPVESDFSDALANDTLEVAPGDTISISYMDDETSSGEKRIHQRTLGSSFNDAEVNFFFEQMKETRNGRSTFLHSAYRFHPGDMLLVSVRDPDADITEEADTMTIKVTTRSGKEIDVDLLEQDRYFANVQASRKSGEFEGVHSGIFLGLLRTCRADDPEAPPNALPISKGDVVTAHYFDRENTRPGVPVERTASIAATQPSEPKFSLFHGSVVREEDKSYDAQLRLEQIRRRPGNEYVTKLFKDQKIATPMSDEECNNGTNPIPVNVSVPVPIVFSDPSRARHAASVIKVNAMAQSELDDAEATGRDPEGITLELRLPASFPGFRVMGTTLPRDRAAGSFGGLLNLRLGPPDPTEEIKEDAPPVLSVNGNDMVHIEILGEDDKPILKRTLKLVSEGRISLTDSSYTADRSAAHVGERFYVLVEDKDRDTGSELDEVEIEVTSLAKKITRKLTLRETLPHSGVFSGTLRPVIFAKGEEIPAVATGGVARAGEELDDRLSVLYGDRVLFKYNDETTLPTLEAGYRDVTGKVFKGFDGDLRVFSKRFPDNDMAVLVQFRLAECLFEIAKEHRRLKQPERSAEAIDEGKFILEEALRNYPDTQHVVEGEFLLANLYQELATEQKNAKNEDAAAELFTEALTRFTAILSAWPEGEFAARAQYHKALCLEMLGDYNRCSEEYVKMTYLFPESPLVGDASIRLATYYYTQEKRYDIAGRIYANFATRFPTHEKADRALFMSAQCHMKQAEKIVDDWKIAEKPGRPPEKRIFDEYDAAVASLRKLIDEYTDTTSKALRAQAMYWAGDASLRKKDYESAFLFLKRTVFEYPETEWARRARGLLLQEAKAFEKLE